MNKFLIASLLAAIVVSGCKKGESPNTSGSGNQVTIYGVMQDRKTSTSTFRFNVALDKIASGEVSIDFTTVAGTASANTDYKPVAGVLKIAANQQQGYIDVEVTGDSTRKPDQDFLVKLSNPKNCSLKAAEATGIIVNKNGLYYPVNSAGYTFPFGHAGYNLVWSDEFNENSINSNNWTFEQGNHGWGNNELQNYTTSTENAFVSAGNLIIEARQQVSNGSNYSSARLISKNKKIFKFGRIDIRAKMPKGKGIWPALWMLGNNIDAVNWPACGEIDILEYLGHESNKIYGTMHWGASSASHQYKGGNYLLPTGSFDQQFHIYSIIWKQDSIQVMLDDIPFFQFTKSDAGAAPYPFNDKFFFIVNVAVGGNWPGSPDATTIFPQRLVVDYIRVFQ